MKLVPVPIVNLREYMNISLNPAEGIARGSAKGRQYSVNSLH